VDKPRGRIVYRSCATSHQGPLHRSKHWVDGSGQRLDGRWRFAAAVRWRLHRNRGPHGAKSSINHQMSLWWTGMLCYRFV